MLKAPQLWLLWPNEIHTTAILTSETLGILDAHEQAHYRQLPQAAMRQQYALTRVLVRTMLSHYYPLPPQDWRFRPGLHGRPEILNPEAAGVRFNVSHARQLIVCALTEGYELGVDVESRRRHNDSEGIARRFFSAREYADLQQWPPSQRHEHFFAYWTLKEAYLKARGLGLSGSLRQFSVIFQPEQPPCLLLEEALQDRAERWALWLGQPDAEHYLALCVERTQTASVLPEIHRVLVVNNNAAGWFSLNFMDLHDIVVHPKDRTHVETV